MSDARHESQRPHKCNLTEIVCLLAFVIFVLAYMSQNCDTAVGIVKKAFSLFMQRKFWVSEIQLALLGDVVWVSPA